MAEIQEEIQELTGDLLTDSKIKKPSDVAVDLMMGTYSKVDRYQVELAFACHDIYTAYYGTEDYDPKEALQLKFKQQDNFSVQFKGLKIEEEKEEDGLSDNKQSLPRCD